MSRKPITEDPRLTAYALGELTSADRAAVEQQISDSVEALLELEAIREVACQLRAALREEATQGSLLALRVRPTPTLAAASSETQPNRRASGKLAVAASCLALVGALGIIGLSGRDSWSPADRQQQLAARTPLERMLRGKLAFNELELKLHNRLAQDSNGNGVVEHLWADRDFSVPLMTDGTVPLYSWDVEPAPQRADGYGLPFQAKLAKGRDPRSYAEDSPELLGKDASRSKKLGLGFYYHNPLPTQTGKRLSQPLSFGVGVESKPLKELGDQVAEFEKLAEPELRQKLLKPSFHRPEMLEQANSEAYAAIHDNSFASPLDQPLSTFSIDVDTAAYSNMRRFLTQGSWPPPDSVRIEELVNYFGYDYTPPGVEIPNLKSQIPNRDAPFAVHLEVAGCPWNAEHRLVRVGLKGKEIALDKRPVSNIVFLIDVSGSMQDANKLPLVKAGLRRLVEQLNENDRVGIVVYAGASGLVLDSTNATQKDVILSSIENLQAGGSTNGGEGIQLAYALARKHFIEKGTNRVILCTDGDFNVGITNQDDLTRLIEEESKSGVFLSVLGFGMGNLKDSTLEKLADKGNGNYAYIDTLREANKVFVEQMTGTLITIAKDVKIQIEFNPALVGAYRLIGYENRLLAAQDFHDDTKDAGEIGAGHTVTALYEVIPPSKLPVQPKEPAAGETLKYQQNVKSPAAKSSQLSALSSQPVNFKSQISDSKSQSSELLTIKLRYKQPDADKSQLLEQPLIDEGRSFAQASTDFRFAASVASFGMILRHSPHRGNATLDAVAEIAQSSLGADKSGYRSEFVGLVRSAKALQK